MKRIVVLILTLVFCNQLQAQGDLPNDCMNAITVCGSGTFVSNAAGSGDTVEISNSSCGGGENNSLWLKITIVQTGTLGFNLTPDDPAITVDYDFYIFRADNGCAGKGNPIRCCTTNPELAGLTSNVTGMNGTESTTTAGPSGNGNGFVRWLDVAVGEEYYIAIDRPVGDGGFTLEWIGSATAGNGAFPIPPTINNIPDYVSCGSNPGYGIFSFDATFKNTINPDPFNEVHIYRTQKDAIDNVNAIDDPAVNPFGIYVNEVPYIQKVYTRVTNIISGCFSIDDFNLIVSDLPTADISLSSNAICLGEPVDVIFKGTPNATIEYSINNGAKQTLVLDNNGDFILNETPSINTNYKLISASVIDASGVTSCKQGYNKTVSVNVLPLPTATISGDTAICEGSTATIAFSGTPNAIITYTVDSVTATITLDASGNATLTTPALTANSTYDLVSVSTTGTPACSQPQTGTVLITVNPLPTATISGDATICSGSTTDIKFVGTPNATVNYTVDGVNASVILDASGNATVTTPALTANSTYTLVSVVPLNTPSCVQTLTGSAVVTVNSVLTASISGTTTICSGNTATITFNGTANVIVNYTVDGIPASINLDATGNATITTPVLSANSVYELVNVTSAGTPPCIVPLTGSATVTVIPSPIVTISGTTTICSGNTATIAFTGTPNTTVTYTVDSVTATIVLDASGNGTVTTPVLTANSTYSLVSVAESVAPFCSQPQTGSAVITVNQLPTVTISGTTTICAGLTTDIIFNGTPNATVNYTVDGVAASLILDGSGNKTITTPVLITNSTYTLVGAGSADTPTCIQAQTGSAIITVKPYSTITATPSTESICSGLSTNIVLASSNNTTTFTWTANATNVTGASDGSGALIAQNLSSNGNTSGVVIYTITATTNGCVELPIDVVVNVGPKPVVTATPNQELICTGEQTNISLTSDIAGTTFSWTVVQSNVTGALAGNGNTIAQTLTATNLNQGMVTYTITPDNNGCIGLPITVVVEVNPIPVVTYTSATGICNLETTNIALSSALSGTTFTWTANAIGVSGASAGTGTTINQLLTLTGEASGNVVYTVTPINNGCNGQPVDISIIVEQLPRPNIEDGTICVDLSGNPIQTYTLDTGLDNATYTFEWYFEGNIIAGATNSTYVATEIGNYGVIATHSTLGCVSLLDTATVNESVPGKILTLSQNAYFSENAMIYATVEGGNGSYVYQLDNGAFQDSNVFTNVAPGAHVVTVNDTNGCTNLSESIYIIGYPKFFTPNGDGYNDTWNIIETGNLVYKKILIYDRYGKLLIQLNPNSNGWDGIYNGQNLPSTDYWFVFDYTIEGEDQVLRAHFSLKR